MNSERLSPRLNRVAQLIGQYGPQPIRLADIGSDHAYLPCNLKLNETISYAIAGEVVEVPFQSAVKEVNQQGFSNVIDVRKGDGLEVVTPEDNINTISICGMGGALIRTILEAGLHLLTNNTIVVLQANIAEPQLRTWLSKHHFIIRDEDIIEDNSRYYEIIVAEYLPSQQQVLSKKQRLFGPVNLRQPDATYIAKWQQELHSQEKVYASMKAGLEDANHPKLVEMEKHLQLIREELARVEKTN